MSIIKLSSVLDSIADALESKGLTKEAAEVDVISNTIDKLSEEESEQAEQKLKKIVTPANIANFIKLIAKKIPKTLLDDLVDALSRDIPASGMRTSADKEQE